MADDVGRWSDELARDPASLAFLPLGETLRRQGQLDLALKIAVRGLERHSHNADAHDLLARIAVDRRELQRAFDEWDAVLRLSPSHLGALKGMAFVRFQQGNTADAEKYLQRAAEQGGDADAARRATRHLEIGDWKSIVLETEVAVVTMAPCAGDGLLVVAASKATPLGLVRRVLDRCLERARRWLDGGGR